MQIHEAETTGTVEGRVVDPSGGAIPGARIVLMNESNGTRSAPVVSNPSGFFSVTTVAPGSYTIERPKGFTVKGMFLAGVLVLAAASVSALQSQQTQPPLERDYAFIGLVAKPGKYEWREHLSVREAIAEAGGRARGADPAAVFFRIAPDRLDVPARLDDTVRPRDVLFIPPAVERSN